MAIVFYIGDKMAVKQFETQKEKPFDKQPVKGTD